jgi:hypothetical protein
VHQTDAIRREAFGARLLDPKHGDVVIRFPETVQALDREEKCLFASSEILCAFSPYFKNCTSPRNSFFFVRSDFSVVGGLSGGVVSKCSVFRCV